MPIKQVLNKKLLYEFYINQQLKMSQIATKLNCCKATVHTYLKKYGIHRSQRLIGKKIGHLTILKLANLDHKGKTRVICKCDCGIEHEAMAYDIKSGNTKSCGCARYLRGDKHPCFTGYKELHGTLWGSYKSGAKSRGLDFTISIEYAWKLFETQQRKCALSGLPIYFSKGCYDDQKWTSTASLDRIDSSKGYIVDNVQWVHKDVNQMKWQFDEKHFITLCKLIAKRDDDNG